MNNLFLLLTVGIILMSISRKSWSIPPPGKKYKKFFNDTETVCGIPHNLLARMAQEESHFRPDIIFGTTVSTKGAQGIMQIMSKWHPNVDPLNPEEAIKYAGSYMRYLYDRFGSWKKALAGYNWGPTALKKLLDSHPFMWQEKLPTETQNYIENITKDIPVQ